MTGVIYLIRNKVNGKGYVGQTIRYRDRFKEHLRQAAKGTPFALYHAMREHGIENFSITVVASCDALLLNDLEKHYIEFYGTFAHGYNMTAGGDGLVGVSMKGRKMPPRTPEHCKKISEYRTGKLHSKEACLKMSKSQKGRVVTDETRAKIMTTMRNKKV